VTISEEAIDSLIRYYCRESGVRRLKQQIEKVYRKAALKVVEDLGEDVLPEPTAEELATAAKDTSDQSTTAIPPQDGQPKLEEASPKPEQTADSATAEQTEEQRTTTTKVRKPMTVPNSVHVVINPENLIDYVGPAIYQRDRIYTHRTPAGVSTGLGYLGNGSGSCLPIEATVMPGSGGIMLTGKLGEVIKESAQLAISFLRTHAYALGLTANATDDILDKKAIHLHMPEGAVGKEGPSAGTAILTALVSLFKGTGISSELAMTGEMTLAGQGAFACWHEGAR
jgi:Lon-like ATP-dependent protease